MEHVISEEQRCESPEVKEGGIKRYLYQRETPQGAG